MNYPTFVMCQLLLDNTTLFDDCSYEDIWEASFIHYRIFEQSEWCKDEQTEYMEFINYIDNDLKEALKPLS